MLSKIRSKSNQRTRHLRLRRKVRGNPERPRLSLYPSHRHLQAQIIDDYEQKTLLGFTTAAKAYQKKSGSESAPNVKSASAFGKYVAEQAKAKGIKKVVFDRGGYLYHGRIRAFAEAARENGLSF